MNAFGRPSEMIRDYTERERQDFLYREPTRMKIEGINMTYEGLVLRIQGSYLSKDQDAMQPHIRAFVDRAVTFTTCPECDGTRLSEAARSSRIRGLNIADACAMQISDLAEWVRGLGEPSPNVLYDFHYEAGDVSAAFAKADRVFEDTFTFARVSHYALEPHVAIADAPARLRMRIVDMS